MTWDDLWRHLVHEMSEDNGAALRRLLADATEAGDADLADRCRMALVGDEAALLRCAAILADRLEGEATARVREEVLREDARRRAGGARP